jgi:superfamily II DNA or RNA helicase
VAASPGQEEGIGFDRAEAFQWARDFLDQHEPLLAQLRELGRGRAQELRQTIAERARQSVYDRLASRPLKDLVNTGSNLRLQPLLDYGVRTALDFLRLPPSSVDEIHGVGEGTWSRLTELIDEFRQIRAEDLRPSADPRTWSPSDLNLVASLELWSGIAAVLGMPHVAGLAQLLKLVRSLKRWTSWLGWSMSTPARRRRIRAQYDQARRWSETEEITDAARGLRKAFEEAWDLEEHGLPVSSVTDRWRAASADLLADLEVFLSEEGTQEQRQAIRRGLVPKLDPGLAAEIESFELNQDLIERSLRSYQIFGAKFILVVGRGLLGDDVGLGKTIEAIAAIAHATSAEGQLHHLVICPAGLVDNWLHELVVTAPGIPRAAFRQPGRERAFNQWRTHSGVLIVPYTQAHLLPRHELPSLGLIVADEAHKVKNKETRQTKATAALLPASQRAVLMSGTLLENRAEEIISLTELVSPEDGAMLRGSFGDGREAHLDPDTFRHALGGFYLRRNQREVLSELPPLVWTDEPISVGPQEERAAEAEVRRRNLLGARRALASAAGLSSAKIDRLKELIEESRAEQTKVLVFSQFLDVVDLALEVLGGDAREISGRIDSKPERAQRIADFNDIEGFAALVIQIDTGGEGINLQSASRVILMEPQYKPSTETQAVGRAHRMGQTRRVVVHRLVAKDTLETRIVERTGFKAELFERLVAFSVLAEAAAQSTEIDPADLIDEELRRLDT